MNISGQRGEGTRARLLRAACEVFAEKGYHQATIAEICERAGANIAAVNYYFHSKENLYVEAWREAFNRSIAAYPPDGGVAPDASPEERLRGRILSLMRRVADPDSQEFEIVQKELANPTGLLKKVMRDSLRPIRRDTNKLVRELLGSRASEYDVLLCEMSIVAQCLHPLIHYRRRKALSRIPPHAERLLSGLDVEKMAEHVFRFSLAGIREVQRRIENTNETSSTE